MHANELRCRAELLEHPVFLLAKGWQLAWSIAAAQYAEYNLTPQQMGVLHCVAHNEGVMQGDLAEAMVIDGATMTGLVSRLERGGFLIRRRAETDRRLVQLYLSDAGRQLLTVLEAGTEQVVERFEERLGTEGTEQLCELLRQFLGWQLGEQPSNGATPCAAVPSEAADVPAAAPAATLRPA
ncbi:MAG: MarR family transcriptional regulator [bacterium]